MTDISLIGRQVTGYLAKRPCLYIVSRGRVARYPVAWRRLLAELIDLSVKVRGRPREGVMAELKFGPTTAGDYDCR